MKYIIPFLLCSFLAFSCTITVEPEFDPHSPQNQKVELVPMIAYYTAIGNLIRTDYRNADPIWVYPDEVGSYNLSYPQQNPCLCGDPIFYYLPQ